MRRYLAALTLALLTLLVLAGPTLAGVGWCKVDPIVRLGRTEYQIIVAVPEANVHQINGPLDFTFSSPRGMDQRVLFLDAGFNGHGETVTFSSHSRPRNKTHVMRLDVPHTGPVFPVMVEVYVNNTLVDTIIGTSDLIVADLPR